MLDGPGTDAISIEGECPQRFQFSPLDVQGHEMNELRCAGTRQDVVEGDRGHVHSRRLRRLLILSAVYRPLATFASNRFARDGGALVTHNGASVERTETRSDNPHTIPPVILCLMERGVRGIEQSFNRGR